MPAQLSGAALLFRRSLWADDRSSRPATRAAAAASASADAGTPSPRRGRGRRRRTAGRGPTARTTRSRPAGSAGPPCRGAATASKASMSPRSSPTKQNAPASTSSTSRSTTSPLCIPGERISTTLPAGLDDQVVARRRGRGAAAAARRRRGSGSAIRRVCTATARPFSSTCASSAPARRRNRGSSRRNDASPCGGRGLIDPAVGRAPALVAVLAEDEELLAGVADRVADDLEPTEVERLPRRAAGDDRDGPHLLGQLDQHVGRVVVDVGGRRVLDDRCQGAVEVQPDDRVRGRPYERGVPLLALG